MRFSNFFYFLHKKEEVFLYEKNVKCKRRRKRLAKSGQGCAEETKGVLLKRARNREGLFDFSRQDVLDFFSFA